jgi:ATP-dependent DNA helicase RecG
MQIIKTQGEKKGTAFIINPKLLADSKLNIKPSLKTIEPYVLEELIKTDLRNYPDSSIAEIFERIKDIDIKEIRKTVYRLVEQGSIVSFGANKLRKYKLA